MGGAAIGRAANPAAVACKNDLRFMGSLSKNGRGLLRAVVALAVVLLAPAIMRAPKRNIHKDKEPARWGRLLRQHLTPQDQERVRALIM